MCHKNGTRLTTAHPTDIMDSDLHIYSGGSYIFRQLLNIYAVPAAASGTGWSRICDSEEVAPLEAVQ